MSAPAASGNGPSDPNHVSDPSHHTLSQRAHEINDQLPVPISNKMFGIFVAGALARISGRHSHSTTHR